MVLKIDNADISMWQNEAGGHRIQRVPPTERRGRVHTSTVTVAVIDKVEIGIKSVSIDECDIEWFSGSGAGGQHRNKHQNCCRLRHIETGIVESAQCRTRSQSQEQALQALRKRVETISKSTIHAEIAQGRKEQVGSGQRGDKIRTIQFQNDSAIDHQTGKRITAEQYMKGKMDQLWPNAK